MTYYARRKAADPEWYESTKKKQLDLYRTNWRVRIATLVGASKHGAKRRGLEFTITTDWVHAQLKAQGYRCARTGLPLELGSEAPTVRRSKNPLGPSLDRKDRLRGYTPDNVQIVCWMYNAAKNEASDEDVVAFAKALLANT